MVKKEGGRGKGVDTLIKDNKKEKRALYNLVRVEYWDHVICNNVNPRKYNPILREVVGWIIYEDSDSILIICERPISKLDEEIQPQVSAIIFKKAILGIWDLGSQSLRSWKTN
jgi:hypothetical protein